MTKSVLRALSQVYGLTPGVQARVGPSLLAKMGLTDDEKTFLRGLADCWLTVRLEDYDQEVQLSFFVLCRPRARAAAALRLSRKTRPLRFMSEANFKVRGGTPVAHCTLLLKKRTRSVVLSFLEKDLTRRSRGLNLGHFLVSVALRATAPFCPQDADMLVEAVDNGSGRLVAFYEKLGLGCARAEDGSLVSNSSGMVRMRGKFAKVLAACSSKSHGRERPEERPIPVDVAPDAGACPARTDEVCAICIDLLDSPAPDEASATPPAAKRRCVLSCGHRFHSDCIQRWLATSQHCPLCKRAAGPQG